MVTLSVVGTASDPLLLRFGRRLPISYYVSVDREQNRRRPTEGATDGVATTTLCRDDVRVLDVAIEAWPHVHAFRGNSEPASCGLYGESHQDQVDPEKLSVDKVNEELRQRY
jgi:hypothetical protein